VKTVTEFAREVLEIDLDGYPLQIEVLEAMSSHPLVVLACGRRGGKSLLSCCWAAYDATCRDLRKHQRKGETRYVLLVAASLTQARALFRTLQDMFKMPMLKPMVIGETQDEIQLSNNVILKVMPCSERTTRGLAASTVLFEELASYVDTSGHQSGEAVYRALAPSVAQFKGEGRIIAPSSPRGQRGVFFRLFGIAQLRDDGFALNCASWDLNPQIDRAFLERERDRDPELFEQEYQASFTAIGGSFIDSSKLTEATRPFPDHVHANRVLAIDPAYTGDDFGIAVACVPHDDASMVYLEHVEALRRPGFNKSLDYVVKLAKDWGVHRVVTDQFSSQAIVEELQKRGVSCSKIPWTGRSNSGKSKAHRYGKVKQLLGQGRLLLLDNAELRSELTEITVSPSASNPGYQIETHGPDDMADASVMAITECVRAKVPAPEVHDLLGWKGGASVLPEHQREGLLALFGSASAVPDRYIDR